MDASVIVSESVCMSECERLLETDRLADRDKRQTEWQTETRDRQANRLRWNGRECVSECECELAVSESE